MGTYAYARVSSDRQEQEETILSQLAELRVRASEDDVADLQEFTDEGFSRDDPVRPALDRLRDRANSGDVDRLYIQAMDRLASGALLVILVEEFQQHGVEVVFLKGSVEDSPEGKFFLHIQGAAAEYERTKIAERTRRGKLYWARQGAMVGGQAPFGYRFVRRTDHERASFEIDAVRAPVVRDMFRWMAEEQLSTRAVALRLNERDVPTAKGASQWRPMAVDRMLRNTSYKGTYVYQRQQAVLPTVRLSQDPYRRRRKTGRKARPEEDWIGIPVPPIVDEDLWDAVQVQLQWNSKYSPRNNKRHQYLLRGLVRCPRCGGNYTGYARYEFRGYRCIGANTGSFATKERCNPGGFSAQVVEDLVWKSVTEALGNPEMLKREYRCFAEAAASPSGIGAERKQIEAALRRVKSQEDRVTEAYVGGVMEMDRSRVEMDKQRQQRSALERTVRELDKREQRELDMNQGLEQVDDFCARVTQGLESMTFDERQQLLRLVVDKIVIDQAVVRVETIIPLDHEPGQLRTLSGGDGGESNSPSKERSRGYTPGVVTDLVLTALSPSDRV